MLWALVGSGRSSAGALQSSGDWLLITWGWCLAVAFAVYVAGGISGADMNPAITLGQALRKQLPWNKVAGYGIAQVLGCFVGAALVFLVYNNAINHFDAMNHIVRGRRRRNRPTARSRRSQRPTSTASSVR
jgi:glycerol uptake facilitator